MLAKEKQGDTCPTACDPAHPGKQGLLKEVIQRNEMRKERSGKRRSGKRRAGKRRSGKRRVGNRKKKVSFKATRGMYSQGLGLWFNSRVLA